jgi:hypothetical protein
LRIHHGDLWSIDAADWSIEPDDGILTLIPPSAEAELQIRTLDFGKSVSRSELLAFVKERAPADARIEEGEWGEFYGFAFEYVDCESQCRRIWVLSLADTVLLVSLECGENLNRSLRDVVDSMLSSLRAS